MLRRITAGLAMLALLGILAMLVYEVSEHRQRATSVTFARLESN